jgi:hypothetical protein
MLIIRCISQLRQVLLTEVNEPGAGLASLHPAFYFKNHPGRGLGGFYAAFLVIFLIVKT